MQKKTDQQKFELSCIELINFIKLVDNNITLLPLKIKSKFESHQLMMLKIFKSFQDYNSFLDKLLLWIDNSDEKQILKYYIECNTIVKQVQKQDLLLFYDKFWRWLEDYRSTPSTDKSKNQKKTTTIQSKQDLKLSLLSTPHLFTYQYYQHGIIKKILESDNQIAINNILISIKYSHLFDYHYRDTEKLRYNESLLPFSLFKKNDTSMYGSYHFGIVHSILAHIVEFKEDLENEVKRREVIVTKLSIGNISSLMDIILQDKLGKPKIQNLSLLINFITNKSFDHLSQSEIQSLKDKYFEIIPLIFKYIKKYVLIHRGERKYLHEINFTKRGDINGMAHGQLNKYRIHFGNSTIDDIVFKYYKNWESSSEIPKIAKKAIMALGFIPMISPLIKSNLKSIYQFLYEGLSIKDLKNHKNTLKIMSMIINHYGNLPLTMAGQIIGQLLLNSRRNFNNYSEIVSVYDLLESVCVRYPALASERFPQIYNKLLSTSIQRLDSLNRIIIAMGSKFNEMASIYRDDIFLLENSALKDERFHLEILETLYTHYRDDKEFKGIIEHVSVASVYRGYSGNQMIHMVNILNTISPEESIYTTIENNIFKSIIRNPDKINNNYEVFFSSRVNLKRQYLETIKGQPVYNLNILKNNLKLFLENDNQNIFEQLLLTSFNAVITKEWLFAVNFIKSYANLDPNIKKSIEMISQFKSTVKNSPLRSKQMVKIMASYLDPLELYNLSLEKSIEFFNLDFHDSLKSKLSLVMDIDKVMDEIYLVNFFKLVDYEGRPTSGVDIKRFIQMLSRYLNGLDTQSPLYTTMKNDLINFLTFLEKQEYNTLFIQYMDAIKGESILEFVFETFKYHPLNSFSQLTSNVLIHQIISNIFQDPIVMLSELLSLALVNKQFLLECQKSFNKYPLKIPFTVNVFINESQYSLLKMGLYHIDYSSLDHFHKNIVFDILYNCSSLKLSRSPNYLVPRDLVFLQHLEISLNTKVEVFQFDGYNHLLTKCNLVTFEMKIQWSCRTKKIYRISKIQPHMMNLIKLTLNHKNLKSCKISFSDSFGFGESELNEIQMELEKLQLDRPNLNIMMHHSISVHDRR
ncbi:hypothetical protein DLAC_06674 [Tieghemostelium lacteum]|uniref:Uncharacterized protein n=1 Tax=Tieghemostelium lacteum TaxID=361077 RepID=A0A151ZFD2_TIELA|nr:hypothetical protein DLAC_06674 [Tieghemostelium lacteum]|eukprot:KYQ92676.1 hypothetical protein DLAC_06674 [Tieghemostelium lacteum]